MSKQDNNLTSIIWPDSSVLTYSHDVKKSIFRLEVEDFRGTNFRLILIGVDYCSVNDPVYISDSWFGSDDNHHILKLSDDDGVVISVKYLKSEVEYL